MNLLSLMVFTCAITLKNQRHGLLSSGPVKSEITANKCHCWAIWCFMKLSFCSQGFSHGAAEQICLLDCLDNNVAETRVERYSRKMRIK